MVEIGITESGQLCYVKQDKEFIYKTNSTAIIEYVGEVPNDSKDVKVVIYRVTANI